MIGKRVDKEPHLLLPGEYTFWERGGGWYACTPCGNLANLTGHKASVETDGSLTISPSIMVWANRNGGKIELFHGWLEKGVWRDANATLHESGADVPAPH